MEAENRFLGLFDDFRQTLVNHRPIQISPAGAFDQMNGPHVVNGLPALLVHEAGLLSAGAAIFTDNEQSPKQHFFQEFSRCHMLRLTNRFDFQFRRRFLDCRPEEPRGAVSTREVRNLSLPHQFLDGGFRRQTEPFGQLQFIVSAKELRARRSEDVKAGRPKRGIVKRVVVGVKAALQTDAVQVKQGGYNGPGVKAAGKRKTH